MGSDSPPLYPTPAKIFVIDAQNLKFLASDRLCSSTDGGLNMTCLDLTSGRSDAPVALHFMDTNKGWLGRTDEGIRYTTDGGQNWTSQVSGSLLDKTFTRRRCRRIRKHLHRRVSDIPTEDRRISRSLDVCGP